MAHGLQEAALQPGTVPQSPQHTLASGTGIPMLPSIHSLQEGPRSHTAFKTTILHSQPTESIIKRIQRSLAEAAYRGKLAKQQKGVFMLRVQIKEQKAEFQGLTERVSRTVKVQVSENGKKRGQS